MTIATTYAKLVALAAASSGITFAPSGLPDTITEDMLPCVVTTVGEATWNEHANGLYRQVRTYQQQVFVRPITQGMGIDAGYSACLAPMQALGNTYVQDITLGGLVDQVGERGDFADGGLQVLTWAGTPYHGFIVTLRVTEKTI